MEKVELNVVFAIPDPRLDTEEKIKATAQARIDELTWTQSFYLAKKEKLEKEALLDERTIKAKSLMDYFFTTDCDVNPPHPDEDPDLQNLESIYDFFANVDVDAIIKATQIDAVKIAEGDYLTIMGYGNRYFGTYDENEQDFIIYKDDYVFGDLMIKSDDPDTPHFIKSFTELKRIMEESYDSGDLTIELVEGSIDRWGDFSYFMNKAYDHFEKNKGIAYY